MRSSQLLPTNHRAHERSLLFSPLCCSFKETAVAHFGNKYNFDTIKFRQLDEYARCPLRLASAVYTNTDTNERTHLDLKPFDCFNNNRPEDATGQVGLPPLSADLAVDGDAAGGSCCSQTAGHLVAFLNCPDPESEHG